MSRDQTAIPMWALNFASCGTATLIAAFPASFVQTSMIGHVQGNALSASEIAKLTAKAFPCYALWQFSSTASGGAAMGLYDGIKTGNPVLDVPALILTAATAETAATIYAETKSMLQASNKDGEAILQAMKNISPAVYGRNLIFWSGVVASDEFTKSHGLSVGESAAFGFAVGGACSVLTMPIVQGVINVIDNPEAYKGVFDAIRSKFNANGGFGEASKMINLYGHEVPLPKLETTGFPAILRGVVHRGGILGIYTGALAGGAEVFRGIYTDMLSGSENESKGRYQ